MIIKDFKYLTHYILSSEFFVIFHPFQFFT